MRDARSAKRYCENPRTPRRIENFKPGYAGCFHHLLCGFVVAAVGARTDQEYRSRSSGVVLVRSLVLWPNELFLRAA